MVVIIGDVAKFQTPSVDHPKSATALVCYPQKCNCACVLPTEVQLIALVCYPQKCNCACVLPAEVGKSFMWVKNLVTAQTQLRLYSEQQRAFGISNICYYTKLLKF